MAEAPSARPMDAKQSPAALVASKSDVNDNSSPWRSRRATSPVWIMEHSFRENQGGGVNPRFLELFELFWAAGYVCHTFDPARRTVRRDDVERWLRTGVRDFGDVNYIFQKA